MKGIKRLYTFIACCLITCMILPPVSASEQVTYATSNYVVENVEEPKLSQPEEQPPSESSTRMFMMMPSNAVGETVMSNSDGYLSLKVSDG